RRADVIQRVGEPDAHFSDLRVSCYLLDQVTRRRLWLLFGILPIAAPKDPATIEIALIRYDEEDRVVQSRIVIRYYHTDLSTVARSWVKGTRDPDQFRLFPAYDVKP